jgi:hypothetical protein
MLHPDIDDIKILDIKLVNLLVCSSHGGEYDLKINIFSDVTSCSMLAESCQSFKGFCWLHLHGRKA